MRTLRISLTVFALSLSWFHTASAQEDNTCSADYLKTYVSVIQEIQKVASFLQAGQVPPNLKEAVDACEAIQKNYKDVECSVSGMSQKAKTADLAASCTTVHQLYVKHGGNTASAEPEKIDDSTPIAKVPVAGLTVKILNGAEMQRALSSPANLFIIDGRVVNLKDSIMLPALIRCTFRTAPGAMNLTLAQDEILKVTRLMEGMISGVRYTRMVAVEKSLSIDCASRSGSALTLGELKAAFSGLIEFTYNP